MSIIKALQDYLSTFPGIELQPLPKVLTDRPDETTSSYALAPSGNDKTTTDLSGCKTFQSNYVFYAKEAASDEIDRQENYDLLEELTSWLEEQDATGNYPVLPAGYEVDSIQVSNAMLFDLSEDGEGLYQIQIQMTYMKG